MTRSWVFRFVNEWRWRRYEARVGVEPLGVDDVSVEGQAARICEAAGRAGRIERSPAGGVWGVM